MKRIFACVFLLTVLGLSGCADSPQRIVLITLDTLRLDAFTKEDGGPAEMPNARAWAAQGLVYERGFSATSTTQPTHASILTGFHPWEHGVAHNGVLLHEDLTTVAEAMSAAGYETGAVVASFPLHRRFGFNQGFDHYDDAFRRGAPTTWQGLDIAENSFYSLATDVNQRAFEMLDRMTGERQFLWVHYFDPHTPYGDAGKIEGQVPASLSADDMATTARPLYDADVRAMDESLGRLRGRLAQDAVFETHVVVTSDHGESFGENGAIGHGRRVSEEQIRVPVFIVSSRAVGGSRAEPVGSIDIGATLLDLAGLGSQLGRGVSLLEAHRADTPVVGMRRKFGPTAMESLADGTLVPLPEHRFYLVEGDRVYRGNSEGVEPAVSPDEAARIQRRFAEFERELAQRDPRTLEDPETREALEALGYVE